jgi:hypothetical protein
MSDFLSNLAARGLGTSEVIRPRTPSLYEPYRADSGPHVARPDFRSPETEREPQHEAGLPNDGLVGITRPKARAPRPLWRDDQQAPPILKAQSADRAEGMPTGESGPAIFPREGGRSDASSAALRAAGAKAASRSESNSPSIPTPEAAAPAVRAVRTSRDETGSLPIGSEPVVRRPRPSEGPRGDLSHNQLPADEPITPAIELPAGASTRSVPWARETFRPTAAPHSGMAKTPDHSRPLQDNASTKNSVLGSLGQSPSQYHPFAPQLRSEEGTSPSVEVSGLASKPAMDSPPQSAESTSGSFASRLDSGQRTTPAIDPSGLKAALGVLRNSAEAEPDRVALRTGFPQPGSGRIQLPQGSAGRSAGLSAGVIRPPVGSSSEARMAAAARGSNRSEAAIHVTIGSVEVRAVFPEKPERRAPSTRPKPGVSLDDYLKRSSQGSR